MSSWTFFIFPMLKGSPHTSSGLGFPCGSLCSVSGVCSCGGPEAAGRWSERAVLHPGSRVSPLSSFPLSQDIFQPALSPRAPRESLVAAPSQVHRRQWAFPPSPGAGDGAPSSQACERISCLSLVLVNAAWSVEQPLQCDSSSLEWLWVYGWGFCHSLPAWPQARSHLSLDFLRASFNSSPLFWAQILVIRGQLSPGEKR